MYIRALASFAVVSVLVCSPPIMLPAMAQTNIAKQVIAKAEAAVKKLQAACGKELASYCGSVTPGEGRIGLCLMAHEDKISPRCANAMFDVAGQIELAANNLWRAAEVCAGDIQKHCGKVQEGEGRIAQCLIKNKAIISKACSAEVARIQARSKSGR